MMAKWKMGWRQKDHLEANAGPDEKWLLPILRSKLVNTGRGMDSEGF